MKINKASHCIRCEENYMENLWHWGLEEFPQKMKITQKYFLSTLWHDHIGYCMEKHSFR